MENLCERAHRGGERPSTVVGRAPDLIEQRPYPGHAAGSRHVGRQDGRAGTVLGDPCARGAPLLGEAPGEHDIKVWAAAGRGRDGRSELVDEPALVGGRR